MAKLNMTLARAKEIVEHVVEVRKKWKNLASPNVRPDELMDALVILNEAREDTTLKDELTKTRRQLAVCRNRETKRNKPQNGSALEHVGDDEEIT